MRKISLKKKIVAYACAAAMVFSSFAGVSIADTKQVVADTTASTIAINGLDTITVSDTDEDTYRGWFWADEKTSSDYKYLQFTYSGTGDVLNETRLQFVDAEGKFSDFYWFAPMQATKFVTVDGTDVPALAEEEQTVVIDLAASGIDTSKGFEGFHIHAGLALKGTVKFSDVKLQTTPEITKSEVPVSTIGINGLDTITVSDTDEDTYRGWFWADEKTSSDYKYLQFTYSGTGDVLNETRLQFVDAEGKFSDFYWFAPTQAIKFVTVDGTDVPALTEQEQTVVIDLAASGVDISKGFEGFHIHAGLALKGTVKFSDVKLQTTPEITKAAEVTTPDTTETPEPTTPADPSTGIKLDGDANGASAMNGTYHIDQVPADSAEDVQWSYLGWTTFKDLANKDFKYLRFTYTGDITKLRFEFEGLDADGKKIKTAATWFDSTQDVHFVTTDGSEIPMVGDNTTVEIDLEKSGIDMSVYNSGFHMHGNSTKAVAFDVAITDAVLYGGTLEEPSTPEKPSTPVVTTPVDPSTGIQLDDKASGMNGTYHINITPVTSTEDVTYDYLGWATFKDLATKDFKYLKLTYTGDITMLRFEFEGFPENGKPKTPAYWFDPTQDVHFVTVDGSEIPMVGNNTTITIDLEKSGIDMGKYNSGIHMHGSSTKDAAFDVTIKDAVLFGGTPTPKETTTAAPTTTAPAKVSAPGKTKVKKATRAKKSAKKVKITLKRVKGAKGYYVQISKSKKFTKKNILVKKYVKKVSTTIKSKKLKNKKKLYVRAKAYKLNGKKKVLSKKWSTPKKVKIKK